MVLCVSKVAYVSGKVVESSNINKYRLIKLVCGIAL